MERSAAERHSTSLKRSFDVSIVVMPEVAERRSRWAARKARWKASGLGSDASQLMAMKPRLASPGASVRSITGEVAAELGRRRIERHRRASYSSVESLVAQHRLIRADARRDQHAAAAAADTAHLEQVGKIAVEVDLQAQIHRTVAVIAHREPLIGRAPPQEDRAHDVQGVLVQHQPAIGEHVGIGQVDRQERIVVADVRSEQQWLQLVDGEFEPRQEACVAVK